MKKILAIIVSLVLATCSVSALAADSKTNSDIANVETKTSKAAALKIEIAKEEPEDFKALKEIFANAAEVGNVLTALPEEVKAELPENATRINEFIPLRIAGYRNEMGAVIAKFSFETLYIEGQTVIGALFVDDEWILVEGTVNEDGSVSFSFDGELAVRLNNRIIALAVISD